MPFLAQQLDGDYQFSLQAVDAAGNVSGLSAPLSITVDTAPPDTLLDSRPPLLTDSPEATFEFHATDEDATLACRLDDGPWEVCSSPHLRSGLTPGPHTFFVAGTDAAGNTDPSPASHAWTVNSPPVAVTAETPGSAPVASIVTRVA